MASDGKDYVYNPAVLRDTTSKHIVQNDKPIMKGEELLNNYLTFISDVKMLDEDLKAPETECAGGEEGLGIVSEYEASYYFPEATQ
jgi:hypothetical protein